MKRLLLLLLTLCVACNSHDEITTDPLPVIRFEQGHYYTLKEGSSLTLSPEVEYAHSYAWIADGVSLSTSASYTFEATRTGTHYITFRATNTTGSSEQELRIDVEALHPPLISFAVDDDRTMTLPIGEHIIRAEVLHGDNATYAWLLDGEQVSSEAACPLNLQTAGDYTLTLRVGNEDGEQQESITLRVVNRLEGEIIVSDSYTVPQSCTLYVDATLWHFAAPSFRWQVADMTSTEEVLAFTPTAEGEYEASLTVTDEDGYSLTRSFSIVCTPKQGTYRRAATAESRAESCKVYEYRPAPGQFINEQQSGFAGENSASAAAAYAEQRLEDGKYLSLGGWGGYVVVGFDHSITNSGGDYDFSIAGNMHEGSSEAGIVWVMQDANGNGQPDDVWYELRGSEWGTENHSRGYAVTYYRPSHAGMGVQWRDNCGASGVISRNTTHTQEYYYPAWEQTTMTLYGSLLQPNTEVDSTTGNQVNHAYAWGYADNQGSDSDTGTSGEAVKNYFKISSAVAANGEAVDLLYIDFVKVQSAINHVAGALGEISTEVIAIKDENM